MIRVTKSINVSILLKSSSIYERHVHSLIEHTYSIPPSYFHQAKHQHHSLWRGDLSSSRVYTDTGL